MKTTTINHIDYHHHHHREKKCTFFLVFFLLCCLAGCNGWCERRKIRKAPFIILVITIIMMMIRIGCVCGVINVDNNFIMWVQIDQQQQNTTRKPLSIFFSRLR